MAKAKPAAATAVNPFASAKIKAPASSTKDTRAIYVATGTEQVKLIETYCEGDTQEKQGKAMKEATREPILTEVRSRFALDWLMKGVRPENPIFATNAQGRGKFLLVSHQDRCANLDEDSYGALAAVIGAANAEENVTKRDDFILNHELLGEEVLVNHDGKAQKMSVMDAIASALQEKFAPSPEVLANLLQIKPVFQTKKGLIDKLPALVGASKDAAGVVKLTAALDAARVVCGIKPGVA